MIVKRRLTILDVAQYFGLAIEYASDLPAGVHGCLEPGDDPRFILINPNQPTFEQQFTIAHEIAHLVLHHNRLQQRHHHWFFTRKWQSPFLAKFCRFMRLVRVIVINKECEADVWALCLLIYLGDSDTLNQYLSWHPKKKFWFFLALFGCIHTAVCRRFSGLLATNP